MSLPLLGAIVVAALALGYTLYGRFVARLLRLDDARRTPAEERNDGVDFVPTKPFYLLGQHFSAIAAAGPIAGPILACQAFGWLPCVLWIGFGVVFIGAVHDLSSLVASIRHRAGSIAEIVRENIGPRAWVAILGFIWLALVYVIIAFADITAATFVSGGEELEGARGTFNLGGGVAAAATMYLLLAVAMGVLQRRFGLSLGKATAIFVPATLGVVWLGSKISTILLLSHGTWATLIMVYCFVAALLPVWTLLQPRGYLGGFVLYLAIAAGVVGVFLGGFEIRQPALTDRPLFGLSGSVFPFLFVTIACGACSGFHGLVCSGTTSKQVARESHCKPIGYGAMLLEGFVALIALATVLILTPAEAKGMKPGQLYGDGMARFLAVPFGEGAFPTLRVFGAMAFSTFVFDTLDVATRLGRYILEELTGRRGGRAAVTATAVTAGVPLAILLAAGKDSYATFWTLFGTSNQLLAGLTLLGVSVWLRRTGRPCWFTVLPMLFMMTITVWSLAGQILTFFRGGSVVAYANGVTAVLLLALAALLSFESSRALLAARRPAS
ncbi:MAG: carbon starvation protein A [Planctomycetes bacterium]|nr:carbon starvation protein A [Planctomycetota bacterium]